jgi:fumarate reductase subunit D
LHFWALGQVLQGEAALDGFLRWTDQPLVKVSEWGIVVLLAAHAAGGVRLLALELLPWRDWQKTLLALAAGGTLATGLALALALERAGGECCDNAGHNERCRIARGAYFDHRLRS